MVKAKIVGEFHTSKNEELKRVVESENYDAIFIEGREDKIFDKSIKPGFGYSFFLLGFAEVVALSRFYADKKNFLASAEKLGIPVFSNIDAPLPIIFNMTNIWIRRFLFPFLVLLSALLTLYGPFFSRLLIGMILLMASPLIFFYVFVVNNKRNDFMANSIIEKVKNNEYNNILVSCGDTHVDEIARNLKKHGIEVDAKRASKRSFLKIVLAPIILVIILIIIVLMS